MECLISVETRIIQIITKVNMFCMLREGSTLIRAGGYNVERSSTKSL